MGKSTKSRRPSAEPRKSKYAQKRLEQEDGIRPQFVFSDTPREPPAKEATLSPAQMRRRAFKAKPALPQEEWPQEMHAVIVAIDPDRGFAFAKAGNEQSIYIPIALLKNSCAPNLQVTGVTISCEVTQDYKGRGLRATKILSALL